MKIVSALFGAAALAGLAFAAYAQGLPPGSYQQSCRDFRMQGGTLTAVCRRANGHGDQLTALNVTHCVGDIGNNNGQLICNVLVPSDWKTAEDVKGCSQFPPSVVVTVGFQAVPDGPVSATVCRATEMLEVPT